MPHAIAKYKRLVPGTAKICRWCENWKPNGCHKEKAARLSMYVKHSNAICTEFTKD